jgi:GxxExxY protein
MLTQDPANEITSTIIGAAIEVHRHLGPGLLESAYQQCLLYEMQRKGLKFNTQVKVPVKYREVALDCGYKLDLIVEEKVIVELKAIEQLTWIHEAQLLTYLRLTGLRVGLVINFNVPVLKQGIRRVMNTR